MECGLGAHDPCAGGLGDVRYVGDVVPVRVADEDDLRAVDMFIDQRGIGCQLCSGMEFAAEEAGLESGDVGVEEDRSSVDIDAPTGGTQPAEGCRSRRWSAV